MILHDEAYYESRKPVKDLGPFKNFLRFIWDGERRAFLDRTAKDWATVGLFYLCFFGTLSSIFILQLWITLSYITSFDRPYIEQSALLAKSELVEARFLFEKPFTRYGSPGLGFLPKATGLYASYPLIYLNNNEDNNAKDYIKSITEFMNDYNDVNKTNYDLECSRNSRKSMKNPCFFNIDLLGTCSQKPYGYIRPYQPCVYIKLNKRFDWTPIYYNNTSVLPEDMPEDLKKIIKASIKPHVWLSCTGVTDFDKQHIGSIEYLPELGFPVNFFPFAGQPEYLSPVVALIFKNVTHDRLITIQCRAWARNIHHNEKHALHFQIMIDKLAD